MIVFAIFNTAQYAFAMYMDVFLLYLILKFTKGEKVEDLPSIAFLENQAVVVKDLVRGEVENQEKERLQARFKI